jgi:hypothetical protein
VYKNGNLGRDVVQHKYKKDRGMIMGNSPDAEQAALGNSAQGFDPSEYSSNFEDNLNCKNCKSENLRRFNGELTASSLRIEHVNTEPIYVCQTVLVCVECGLTELIIPPRELERFRKLSAIGS